jgi:hypothetical protein
MELCVLMMRLKLATVWMGLRKQQTAGILFSFFHQPGVIRGRGETMAHDQLLNG